FLLLAPPAAWSEIAPIEKGQRAPYTGTLFDTAATQRAADAIETIKRLTEELRVEREKSAEKDGRIEALSEKAAMLGTAVTKLEAAIVLADERDAKRQSIDETIVAALQASVKVAEETRETLKEANLALRETRQALKDRDDTIAKMQRRSILDNLIGLAVGLGGALLGGIILK
ncbi:MAG: hypothetical protein ACRDGM_06910, partial [bacterium]